LSRASASWTSTARCSAIFHPLYGSRANTIDPAYHAIATFCFVQPIHACRVQRQLSGRVPSWSSHIGSWARKSKLQHASRMRRFNLC
jgi:hypothetical protein